MKKTTLFYAIIALPFCFSVSAQSLLKKFDHVLTEPHSYQCFRTAEKMQIDGKLTEDSWEKAQSTTPFVDIQGKGFATPKYGTTAKMLWDEDYLYVGAILEEDDIIANLTQRDTIIYKDNDFEVFIDPDNDGLNYFEIETNARGVIFDLMLDKAYRNGGEFMDQWNCPGLKLAIHTEGSLNNSDDKDKYWSVEMAIPYHALKKGFNNKIKAGQYWRINFSRVQWLKLNGPEENWVWSPTGEINMHMPDRWGFLHFDNAIVGKPSEMAQNNGFSPAIYKLLWAMYYAQKDSHKKTYKYICSKEDLHLTKEDLKTIPQEAKIEVEATKRSFVISIDIPTKKMRYLVNQNGKYWEEKY